MFSVNAIGPPQIARAIEADDGGWYAWEFTEFYPEGLALEVSPMTNPVLHRSLLYLLGTDGRLALHNDSRHNEGFRVLDKPNNFVFECDDYYLFDSDEGDLMALLMGHRGSPVHVVKLNEQIMEWEEVESLEGRALFTGTLTTTMVKTSVKWMQNKIFTPRLYDWPEMIEVDLIDRVGELAFVPVSTAVMQHGGVSGTGIWMCGLGPQEAREFWEAIKMDYSIWVDFSKFKLAQSCIRNVYTVSLYS
ncbi:unnamed protein product [Urochloa decumbens]|uniref:KIB1-4 beta-propeller domain-containing protein n=1 Tax=Urochloa decumbens TaxID=240449 RepID=A0ABC9EXA3_9POAL